MKKRTIAELELKILQVLWKIGNRGSVQDIMDSWLGTPVPGYTTILKKLQVMEDKKLVTHQKAGRAFEYMPAVSKNEVSRSKIKNMLSTLFLGNKLEMAGAFFSDTKLSREELEKIKEMIKQQENEND